MPTRGWWLAVLQLTGLLAAVGLATSRIGLILHELVGHGGAALAVGGEVDRARLFWFAGGWIRYELDAPGQVAQLVVALGGIAVELAVGVAVIVALARRDSLAVRIVRGVGAALVIHGGWYLATGTWHGYGDGVLMHRELGTARYPIAIAIGLGICAITYASARMVIVPLAAQLPGSRRARIAGMVLAMAVAGALQIGLALGEVRVRGDTTYGAIMKPARERAIERDLAAWQREQARRGMEVTDAERARLRRQLARRHREPPFMPVLGVALALAVAAGMRRVPAHDANTSTKIAPRLVGFAIAAAVGSIMLVIAIDAAFL